MIKTTELLYTEDFLSVVQLGREMHDEVAPDEPFDDLEVTANLFMVVGDTQRSSINVWIVKSDDMVVGFGVGVLAKPLYTKVPNASLVLWYIKPDYRKTLAAFEILHNFEHWARLNGVYRIEVGAHRLDPKINSEEADKINKMFKRRGFKRAGEVFYRIV